ncbi:AAA-ATPase ASD, mitochondrial-like [Humulus lupulus]|uniref:AAA-ATPase ASD, mitochondrial-like n=1 Tax=Humulus lupulus TaxID=3486 RepID=UPI002B40EA38|nr:AAA-ATPase ASD, mitochondrial-like [Humulus lupulus]
MFMGEMLTQFGSIIASIMFGYAMFQQYFPYDLRRYLTKYTDKVVGLVYPYIHITFNEYSGDRFKRSEIYLAIQNYLSTNSTARAKRLKADDIKDTKSLVLTLADNEEVTDDFQGVKLWWTSYKSVPKNSSFSWYPNSDEKRFYRLTFHRRHRELITTTYLNHLVEEGKSIAIKNRQRKLYTNGSGESYYGGKRSKWSHVLFEHPASFDTLAMDPKKKQEIINDLLKFKKGKDYYAKIGKAWKRGYLLYGPPGTGKSTMISAMANFLDYDVYDLELTAVKDNTELKKLLIDTSNKSIIVIEDIDCSLDLTGQRKKEKEKDEDEDKEKSKDPIRKKAEEDNNKSKVTLSGLLNFIDGIWSACGGERLIVFTTNYVDKLDPALIRRGRMDKHIELSYCGFEAFKVLARNYLDVESHDLFPTIERLLGETEMTPADVAENLMPKSDEEDADKCLKSLVEAIENAKEEAIKKKAEDEAKLKEEEEAKLKAQEEEKVKAEKEKLEKESEPKPDKVDVKCKCGNGTLDKEVKENGSVTT